jgi:V8-like Glu-specific endopeptidase
MKLLLTLALTVSTATAFALPRAPHDALKVNLKSNIDNAAYDFEGIVKLSNCSGSLVQFSGQPDTAKAIVMTNGHCIQKPGGFLEPGEVWVNRAISRTMKIFDKNMKLSPINATKILYATMTDTDVAFYELNESYASIEARTGVRPLEMDTQHPVVGLNIDIISGYWDRGYSCDIDGFVFQIKEAKWTWTDSIRYTSGCDTIGGTSGSPIIQRGTRTVVAINNTSNESGERCTMDNPCEVDQNGTVTVSQGVRYGQQTYKTYSCLTPDFRFDLTRRGCELPK